MHIDFISTAERKSECGSHVVRDNLRCSRMITTAQNIESSVIMVCNITSVQSPLSGPDIVVSPN